MKLLEQLKKLDYLHYLISRKATGSLNSLASKLNVSKRTVQNPIKTLEELGAEISFCKSRNSYCYKNNVDFNFQLIK